MENTTGDILKKWKVVDTIPKGKERKKKEDLKVSFTKEGNHYLYGSGQKKNYKFEAVLEYQEYFKIEKSTFVEWLDIETGIKYYSAMELLNNSCLGNVGEIQQHTKLRIKGNYTFVKRGSAVVLTFSKN